MPNRASEPNAARYMNPFSQNQNPSDMRSLALRLPRPTQSAGGLALQGMIANARAEDPRLPTPMGRQGNPSPLALESAVPAVQSMNDSARFNLNFPPSNRNDPNTPLGQMQGMVDRLRPSQQFLQNQQQSIARSLNAPIERDRRTAAGVSNAIPAQYLNPANPNSFFANDSGGLSQRRSTAEADNVLRGQAPGADTSMRPLNIPGMVFDPSTNSMVPESRMQPIPTGNDPSKGLGGMTPNQFREAQRQNAAGEKITVPMSQEGKRLIGVQQAVRNSQNVNGKQYSPPDWQARAERQSLLKDYMRRGGRGRAGFNRFVNNYYMQGGSNYYGDTYQPGDRAAANRASYRILRPGAVDQFGRIGAIGRGGMNGSPDPAAFANQGLVPPRGGMADPFEVGNAPFDPNFPSGSEVVNGQPDPFRDKKKRGPVNGAFYSNNPDYSAQHNGSWRRPF
jgi:hypothetical protein